MKIASITPLTYTPGELSYFQFIRGGIGTDYHQGPKFHRFADGDVRMVWQAYDFDECSENSVTLYSDTKDQGVTWSDPQVYLADFTGGQQYPTILLLSNSDEALMCLVETRHKIEVDEKRRVVVTGADYFQDRTTVYIRRSADGGRTFDRGFELTWQEITGGKGLPGGGMYYGDLILLQLVSGRILLVGNYLDTALSNIEKNIQHFTCVCMISDDKGKTWRRGGEITVDTPRGVMETQIVETSPNQLFCLFRTKGGYQYQASSIDGGESWSASSPSPLPSPESMARMIKLQSGNLLVVWNSVSSTTQQPRHPLSATLSKDGGKSWCKPKVIADETGGNQLSNHGIIQLDDGRILLAISHYRHVRPMTSDLDMALFDELWLSEDYPMPLTWKFRTDPTDIGESEKWFESEPGSEWTDIQTDSDWTSQGYDYHGSAWYSVEFECPEELRNKPVLARFGAVDGTCHIWLDGKKAGSQLISPEVMWDRPFFVNLGALTTDKKHRLVVCVTKDVRGAGIWKPVAIKEKP